MMLERCTQRVRKRNGRSSDRESAFKEQKQRLIND